jgi:hypothetical protein
MIARNGDVTNCSHGRGEMSEPFHFEFAEPGVSARADSPGDEAFSKECCDPELAADVSAQNAANNSPERLPSETCDPEFATRCLSARDATNEQSVPGNQTVRKSAPKKKLRVAKKAADKTPKQRRTRTLG